MNMMTINTPDTNTTDSTRLKMTAKGLRMMSALAALEAGDEAAIDAMADGWDLLAEWFEDDVEAA